MNKKNRISADCTAYTYVNVHQEFPKSKINIAHYNNFNQQVNFRLGGLIMSKMKNIDKAEVMVLKEQVSYQPGQVVSKTLAQNDALSITLFSFDKGEEISTHESDGDAFVICLDGVGRITIDSVEYELHEGESIVMPANHPHAVYGKEQFKMLLVVVF